MQTKTASSRPRTQKENLGLDYQWVSKQLSLRICSELCTSYGTTSQTSGAPQCTVNEGLMLSFSDHLYGVDG